MQSAKKHAKLEELTLLKVRLWLVLEYFWNGNFRELWYWAGEFSSFWTGIPGGPGQYQKNESITDGAHCPALHIHLLTT